MTQDQLDQAEVFYQEMRLASQMGDQAAFEALIDAQVLAVTSNSAPSFEPDTLAEPYDQLRGLLMDGTLSEVDAFLRNHRDLSLNTAQGRYGGVPLIWATARSNNLAEVIELLIAGGARTNWSGHTGFGALHALGAPFNWVSERPDLARAVDLLVQHGAEVEQLSSDGLSPLHVAILGGQAPLVAVLLSHGADANRTSPVKAGPYALGGQPPLMMAGGNVDMVKSLLDAGADPSAEDREGRSVLETAKEGSKLADQELQDRLAASEAEHFDRQYAADYAMVVQLLIDALESPLAAKD